MQRSLFLASAAISLGVGLSSCGNESNSSAPTTSVAQVAGTWTGSSVLTGVTDGECVGALLQQAVGTSAGVTLTVQQTDTTLTAALLSQATQHTCSYSGSVAGNTMTLTLTSCDANAILNLKCGTGGRDITLMSSTITATVAGNTLGGTQADSWNVLIAATSTSVGTLKSNETLSLTK